MRALTLFVLSSLLAGAVRPLAAQDTPPGVAEAAPAARPSPFYVKYGKWLLLAGSVGMNYAAAREHDRAEAAFDDLEQRCLRQGDLCFTGEDGSYVNPVSEELYQYSLRKDASARRWLVAGETALLGAAVMFIWELTRPDGPPENIPFEPEVSSRGDRTQLGFRLAF